MLMAPSPIHRMQVLKAADSFTYTITDSDGDTSTTTVTLDLLKDSIPNILRISNLTVDEDGLPECQCRCSTAASEPE